MSDPSLFDDMFNDDDRNSESEVSLTYEEQIQRIRENDPFTTLLDSVDDNDRYIQNMTDGEWEELGRDIANNTHLTELNITNGSLNDQKMLFLSRGLTRSNSIFEMGFYSNELSVAAVRNMMPFLQNARNLTRLDLDDNNLQSEGFNVLLRALQNSPIKRLMCSSCGIESIEIDTNHIPRYLKELHLDENSINAGGCRGLVKLLQGGNATLEDLYLRDSGVDDEGVEILVDALQSNTSLRELYLGGNTAISTRGNTSLLKLVNDISSIEATLRSNHTLSYLLDADERIQTQIYSLEAAGRAKVIQTQLNSKTRAELAAVQGVNHSVYSEINPLHLPEVLALVGHHHGQGELYIALKSSIAGVISIVNREQCIEVQMKYHLSKLETLGAELAAIKATRGGRAEDGESRSSKRRRKWWWGLWGR